MMTSSNRGFVDTPGLSAAHVCTILICLLGLVLLPMITLANQVDGASATTTKRVATAWVVSPGRPSAYLRPGNVQILALS